MAKMKPCPFCGETPKAVFPAVSSFTESGTKRKKWDVTHFCGNTEHGLKLVVNCYGYTRKEAIERWNTRAGEKEDNHDTV